MNCNTKGNGKASKRWSASSKWDPGRGKPGGGHYTSRLLLCELRLISNMHNKPEPDMMAEHSHRGASPLGGVAQRGALAEQPQLFNTPQTSRSSDDYWTPKWLFDIMGLTFDLDVACPPEGPYFTPTKHFYTKADDGLAQPWHGRVFMNPPYSKPTPWVHKFLEHGNGVALTLNSKSKWFDAVWSNPNVGMVNLPQHFAFHQGRIPWVCVLWAMGNDNIEAIAKVGHLR